MENLDNILLLSHISDLSGPTEALEAFLIKKKIPILYAIYNPLEYCKIAKRTVKLYNYGSIKKRICPINIKYERLFTWFVDCLVIIYYSLISGYKYKLIICCDSLNVVIGLLLKILNKGKKIIFYFIDWTPVRFKNRLLNIIYQKITYHSAKNADEVWCVSRRLAELQIKKGIPAEKIKYVPVGVPDYTCTVSDGDIEYKTIVFLGAMERTKGIDLVMEAWPYLIKEDPKLKLIVIGRTPGNSNYYESILKTLPNIEVLGVLTHDKVLETIKGFGIGLAPYSPDNDSVSFYGDPSRIKDYLVCGLPVVVTSVPDIASEIKESHAGKIIDFSREGLISGVIDLTKNRDANISYRKNAVSLAQRYKWDNIFENAFKL